jgi:hypothetical protein
MRCQALLALVYLSANASLEARAQGAPAAGRPAQYSGLVGQYTMDATAAPTTVHVEEPILLRVRIRGKGPAGQHPRRELLRIFPPTWDDDFYLEPLPAEDRLDPERGVWDFAYRLRPKHDKVEAIAGLKLVFYDSARQRYQTAYLEADLPLTVRPRPAAPGDWQVPLAPAPSSFHALTPGVLSPPVTLELTWPVIGAGLLLPPLLCWLAFRLTRQRQSLALPSANSAALRALRDLQSGTAPVWDVVHTYLRNRLGCPATEPSPAEVAGFLKRRGLARPVCEQARLLLAACDASRYAPHANGDARGLSSEAIRLIQAMEADRCLA